MRAAATTTPNRRVPDTDHGYADARLRGMRSRLLPSSFLERLIAASDLAHVVKELMDTDYGADLEQQLVRGRAAGVVDDALRNNMVRDYRTVLRFMYPGARQLVSTLLGRWDVFNMKTILRGTQNHVVPEEIRANLMPVGYLSAEELDALLRLDDVTSVIDTVAMWGYVYAAPLRKAFPQYAKTNDLAPLELELDREYAEWAAVRVSGDSEGAANARRILGMQIDTLNLVMVFRLLKSDVEQVHADEYFLRGGRSVTRKLYNELAMLSDVDEVLDRLRHTPYAEALDAAALRYLETSSIPVFERSLEELLMRRVHLAGVRDAQGVGLAISYLFSKQNEVTNIRIIVRGKAAGIPADRVREELILV